MKTFTKFFCLRFFDQLLKTEIGFSSCSNKIQNKTSKLFRLIFFLFTFQVCSREGLRFVGKQDRRVISCQPQFSVILAKCCLFISDHIIIINMHDSNSIMRCFYATIATNQLKRTADSASSKSISSTEEASLPGNESHSQVNIEIRESKHGI